MKKSILMLVVYILFSIALGILDDVYHVKGIFVQRVIVAILAGYYIGDIANRLRND